MKKLLFGLSLVACAASAGAATDILGGVHCISFSPAGYCDAMQFNSLINANWHNYDCAGSDGKQTRAVYPVHTLTYCSGKKGCQPAQVNGWDSFKWRFDLKQSTGTLTGMLGGTQYTLQQDMPVAVTKGACDVNQAKGGVSSLAR
jgi:hypothetical protein